MSEYSDVIACKLRLKGKTPLCVKSDGIAKKKKHKKQFYKLFTGDNMTTDSTNKEVSVTRGEHEDERLTPAEKRYLQRWQQIEMQRLAKCAKKFHRDRIQEFNHYLANLTEHYDIPKIGPG